MKCTSETYNIYFRLWPFRYVLARHKEYKYWCLVKKEWDNQFGFYRWREVQRKINRSVFGYPSLRILCFVDGTGKEYYRIQHKIFLWRYLINIDLLSSIIYGTPAEFNTFDEAKQAGISFLECFNRERRIKCYKIMM